MAQRIARQGPGGHCRKGRSVGAARERPAVLRARPVGEHRARVLRRDVADVGGEPVAGIHGVQAPHQAVAGDLGDDGGGRDRRALRVAVDDRDVRRRERAEPEAVDEARHARPVQLGEDGAEPPEVRPVEPLAVDLGRRDHADGDPRRRGQDRVVQPLALVGIDLLRVVESRERPDPTVAQRRVVEEDAGDDQRAGERAAPRLVRTCDEARLEAPVEPEQALTRGDRHAPRISLAAGRDRAVLGTAS